MSAALRVLSEASYVMAATGHKEETTGICVFQASVAACLSWKTLSAPLCRMHLATPFLEASILCIDSGQGHTYDTVKPFQLHPADT